MLGQMANGCLKHRARHTFCSHPHAIGQSRGLAAAVDPKQELTRSHKMRRRTHRHYPNISGTGDQRPAYKLHVKVPGVVPELRARLAHAH